MSHRIEQEYLRTLHFLPPFLKNPAFVHDQWARYRRGGVNYAICVERRHHGRDERQDVGGRYASSGSNDKRSAIRRITLDDATRERKRAAQRYRTGTINR